MEVLSFLFGCKTDLYTYQPLENCLYLPFFADFTIFHSHQRKIVIKTASLSEKRILQSFLREKRLFTIIYLNDNQIDT